MTAWRTLAEEPLRDRLLVTAEEIAAALAQERGKIPGASLSEGKAGVALFLASYGVATGQSRYTRLASRLLADASKEASASIHTLGLFGGLSGLAWTMRHIHSLLTGEKAAADLTEEVDVAIAEAVREEPWLWEFDLVYGLVGIGWYVLTHPDETFREETLEDIVARLDELASRSAAGCCWHTPPELMLPSRARRYPQGRFDLGLAHGTAGVIGFLGQLCARGLGGSRVGALLREAVRWTFAARRPDDDGSAFAAIYEPSPGVPGSCRSAWCYGDPGMVVALLSAARGLGEARWEEVALAVARHDSRRPRQDSGVTDAGLCHGSAGLGHFYNRLYQATGEPVFASTAKGWLEHTLTLRRVDAGLGGFQAWWPETGQWRPTHGYLTGSGGIGLALLAATVEIEPEWDGPMLLTLPARNASGMGK